MSAAHIVSPEGGLASSVDPFTELNGGIAPAWLLNSHVHFTGDGEPRAVGVAYDPDIDPEKDLLVLDNKNQLFVDRLGAYAINALVLYDTPLETRDLVELSKGRYRFEDVDRAVTELAEELNEAAGQELLQQVTTYTVGSGRPVPRHAVTLNNVFFADYRQAGMAPSTSPDLAETYSHTMGEIVAKRQKMHTRKDGLEGRRTTAPRRPAAPAQATTRARPKFGRRSGMVAETPATLWHDTHYEDGRVAVSGDSMVVPVEGFKPRIVKEGAEESGDWRSRAACRRAPDPDVFFPVGTSTLTIAQTYDVFDAYCKGCPVIRDCRSFGERMATNGIWGGMSRDMPKLKINIATGRIEEPEQETTTISAAIEKILAAKAMDSSVLLADAVAAAGGEEVDLLDDEALLAETVPETPEYDGLRKALTEVPQATANVVSLYWGVGCEPREAVVIAGQLGMEESQISLLLEWAERKLGKLLPAR